MYGARILADSISQAGDRITTMEVVFPRFVLAEFNTHRMLSRNSASSRAIPVSKLLERIKDDPAMPVWWGQYQKGMSAQVELEGEAKKEAKRLWLQARDQAVRHALLLKDIGGKDQGLHKQITNRILEPWMWQTVIVTATDWSNFYALRISEYAQPEIMAIAKMMRELQEANSPQLLESDEWHLPLVSAQDRDETDDLALLRKLSAARCARVSYLTHDGKRDLEADFKLHDTLIASGHMSPCEHPARPMAIEERDIGNGYSGNFYGWVQYRKLLPNEGDYSLWH